MHEHQQNNDENWEGEQQFWIEPAMLNAKLFPLLEHLQHPVGN